MSATEVFTKFYENEQSQIHQVTRGKRPFEIEGYDAWKRLDLVTQTTLNVFFKSYDAAAGNCQPDKIRLLGLELFKFFQGHTAEELLQNPDFLVCLKMFLGEE